MRSKKVKAGKWQAPAPKGYRLFCCDCGLVHRMEFRVAGVRKHQVQFRCWRDDKATKEWRKQQRIRIEFTG